MELLVIFAVGLFLFAFALRRLLRDPPIPEGAQNLFAERWGKQQSSPVGSISQFPTSPAASGPPSHTIDKDWASLVDYLSSKCPCIPADPEKIDILLTPAAFYECLTSMIAGAQHSIVISALYIGDGPKSKAFVSAIVNKIEASALAARTAVQQDANQSRAGDTEQGQCRHPHLTIDLVLDYHRMRDKQNLCTVAEIIRAAESKREFCTVRVHLFQTPSALSCYMGLLPSRAREVLGVQHTKVCAIDGRDVVITGANLSDDYFTNRQDRYMVLRDNEVACSFFVDLVRTIAGMSHLLRLPDTGREHAATGSPVEIHKQSGLVIGSNSLGVDPMRETAAFKRRALALVNAFVDSVADLHRSSPLSEGGSGGAAKTTTLLFPTVQYGRLGIHHDACVVRRVLLAASRTTQVFLTSPYLNMYSAFLDVILESSAKIDLITASVETNGWRGQRGFAGLIPSFYLQLERGLFYLLKEFNVSDRVHIQEFKEPGTSYHAKGVWICPCGGGSSGSDDGNAGPGGSGSIGTTPQHHQRHGMPYLAAYGSTNYGFRSVHKDIESEVFLFTTDPGLRAKIGNELHHLLRMSATVDERRFTGGRDGRFQPVVALVAQLGQSFL